MRKAMRSSTANTITRPSRGLGRLLASLLIVAFIAAPGLAEAQGQTPYGLYSDPTLERLVAESLSSRPEIAGAEATVRAQRARVPQAGAWPDPMLQVGVQNDGFASWEVGKMETSYYSVMLSQTFPWPGKSGLRSDIAELGVGQSKLGVTRLRLSTEADVRRLYVGLLLVRDRMALLDKLTNLWAKAVDVARAVYESGGGSLADMLRSRLALRRLRQRRLALAVEESALVQGLNRLRGQPLDQPIETSVHLIDLGVPKLFDEKAAIDDAIARSPELAAARISITAAGRAIDFANRSYYPDLVVSAGIMPRGGDFQPMWLLSVGGTIPVFAGSKQSRAVEEGEARASAARAGVDGTERLLRLRVVERWTALSALLEILSDYSDGLLVESRATADSTLAQYQVGKVTFASVLDANAGVLADEDGYLQALAEAQQIVIAGYEVSLSQGTVSTGGGLGSANMPGQGATNASPAGGGGATPVFGGSASEVDKSMSSGM
jgi:outer membrane protein TolC